ncbi:alpha-N-acetylgalactosamine-specific lectin-like [Branchiostoma floridae x Branchiostoma japonicum]
MARQAPLGPLGPGAHLDRGERRDPLVLAASLGLLDALAHLDPRGKRDAREVLGVKVCPANGYTVFRGTCYKAYNTGKSFSDSAAACRVDGGTLAMPRDAETNAFLKALYACVSPSAGFWFGLHDRRIEGKFEWIDGTALGRYNSWSPGQPDNFNNEDCVHYFYADPKRTKRWNDAHCGQLYGFICQVNPGKK